jgi:hypothetical protein
MIATIGWAEEHKGSSGQAADPGNPSHDAIGSGRAAKLRAGSVGVAGVGEEAGAGAPAGLSVCRDR